MLEINAITIPHQLKTTQQLIWVHKAGTDAAWEAHKVYLHGRAAAEWHNQDKIQIKQTQLPHCIV
jgi:hypothetical protein